MGINRQKLKIFNVIQFLENVGNHRSRKVVFNEDKFFRYNIVVIIFIAVLNEPNFIFRVD